MNAAPLGPALELLSSPDRPRFSLGLNTSGVISKLGAALNCHSVVAGQGGMASHLQETGFRYQ